MPSDVVEVSYTGDLLAHRRCPRSWAYEKYAGFHPYEQIQAMEGRLVHHAMEWLARKYADKKNHATADELREQLEKYFRILWARGIRTAFTSKQETLDRVMNNLFPAGSLHQTVRVAIEGAQHTEYELRTVRKLVKGDFAGKGRLMLTGVLDLVLQQEHPLTYARTWQWTDLKALQGEVVNAALTAKTGDLEIWDYKGTRSNSPYIGDYVRQLLTYSALYQERSGKTPVRCVLFFVNEPKHDRQLLAIPVDPSVIKKAEDWTTDQVRQLRGTVVKFQRNPISVDGGNLELHNLPVGQRTDAELRQQCTACGLRFDCGEYKAYLGSPMHPDIRLDNVNKN